MESIFSRLVTSVFFVAVSTSAIAVPITIDADNYAPGTNISTISPGVWLQSISHVHQSGSLMYSDVYVDAAPALWTTFRDELVEIPEFGTNAFSHQQLAGPEWTPGRNIGWNNGHHYGYVAEGETALHDAPEFSVLGIRFFEPTDFVSIRSLASLDLAYMYAYDSFGNEIGSIVQEAGPDFIANGYSLSDVEISRAVADIAFVVIGGGGTPTRVNQITYNVPEPSSLALVACGLLGIGWRRLRVRGH